MQDKIPGMEMPLSLRFFHLFFKGFFATVREKIIDGLVLVFALVFSIARYRREHIWELVFPWVEAACFVIIWHSISAASQLIKQLDEERKQRGTERPSGVLHPNGSPVMVPVAVEPLRSDRSKVIALASVLGCLSLVLAYVALFKFVRTSTPEVTRAPEPATSTLTVNFGGTGSGIITCSPSSLACSSSRKGSFATGTVVSLTATANTGSIFGDWGGVTGYPDRCAMSK